MVLAAISVIEAAAVGSTAPAGELKSIGSSSLQINIATFVPLGGI